MLNPAAAQVAQELCDMFICKRFAGFQFNNKFTLDQQVCGIVPKRRAIFVEDLKGVLLFHLDACLAKTVRQAVLVNLLQMPMPQVAMQRKSSFANSITQPEDFPLCLHISFLFLCLLRLFAAILFLDPLDDFHCDLVR